MSADFKMDVESVGLSLQRFGWADYCMFVFMLLLCVLIGIYFGFVQKTQTTQEYLVGGRTMLIFPISLSLIASFISGITLLGLPAEVYGFGIQYLYVSGGVITMGFALCYIYLPVFHGLNITSTYEYLELRFDRRLRLFGSIMFTVSNVAYLPIVIYVPALAFNQVTGLNIHIITPVVCIVCIFYTCVGGLKAVVWTDVVQTFVMFGSIILVIFKGTVDVGGIGNVFHKSWDSGRIEAPDFDPNPTTRHTIWSQVIGGFVYWVQANSVSQNMIQRYLALPSLKAAQRAAWIFGIGVIILMMICTYCGLLMYATYYDCDPLTTKLARAKDQMLPLFVMRTLGDLPGLSGLFIAGVFSAALSSLSTCLNSLAAIVLEDFVKPFLSKPLTDRQAGYLMRGVVVGMGAVCLALVFVVENAGSVLQLTMTLEAITNGPLVGIFTMGMLMPWIHATAALSGGVTSLIFMAWLSLNAQAAVAQGHLRFPHKPLSIEGCTYDFSSNITENVASNDSDVFVLFRISYMWYSLLGISVSTLVASIVNKLWKPKHIRPVQPKLVAPFVRKYLDIIKFQESSAKFCGSTKLNNDPTIASDMIEKDGAIEETKNL